MAGGSIVQIGTEKFRMWYDAVTGESGIQQKVLNKTGEASVKGKMVCPSQSVDNAVQLVQSASEDGLDPVGCIYEAGIADGSEMWIWKNGSKCQVLFIADDTTSKSIPTRHYVACCAYGSSGTMVSGRVYNIEVPVSTPAVAEHFRECGHVYQTKAAGANVLVLIDMHFN